MIVTMRPQGSQLPRLNILRFVPNAMKVSLKND